MIAMVMVQWLPMLLHNPKIVGSNPNKENKPQHKRPAQKIAESNHIVMTSARLVPLVKVVKS